MQICIYRKCVCIDIYILGCVCVKICITGRVCRCMCMFVCRYVLLGCVDVCVCKYVYTGMCVNMHYWGVCMCG